jgi:hypothetical protein
MPHAKGKAAITMPLQATLTGTAITKLGNANSQLALSSQAVIGLSFTQPFTVTITSFPAITYRVIMINGLTMTTTVSPFDSAMIAQAGTFNPADHSIFIPRLALQITVNVSGSFSTASGPAPLNITQSGALSTDLTTGRASSDPFDSGTVFNDQGSPLQPSGKVTLVGDGHLWNDDGNPTTLAGMTSGAIELAGITSPLPSPPSHPVTTTVPDVIDDDYEQASSALTKANLKMGGGHTREPGFVVTGQNPQSGATVVVGSVVDVTMGPANLGK